MSKNNTLTIEWKRLERIAEFYQFPVAIFLYDLKEFPKHQTRENLFREKAELFDEIKEIVKKDGVE